MTEEEWRDGDDPATMLGWLTGRASDRKLRLFMVACCRRVWAALDEEGDRGRREAVEVAERFADGLATDEEREYAFGDLTDGNPIKLWDDVVNASVADFAEWDAIECAAAEAMETGLRAVGEDDDSDAVRAAEGAEQAKLLRCVFGNPSRPAAADPRWVTPTASTLAAACYAERSLPSGALDPLRLTILADALEEAGCADADLLSHLRSPGPHVRGCWALDLVLTQHAPPTAPA